MRLSAGLVVASFMFTGCSPANDAGSTMCDGQERQRLVCDTEVDYQGISTKGGVSVLNLASGDAEYHDKAIRRINEQVEQYVAAQRRLCDEYNKCVIDGTAYHEEAKSMRERLTGLAQTADAFNSESSYGKKKRLLAELYQAAVPASQRAEEVGFQLAIEASLPPPHNAARSGTFAVQSNEPLPTGAEVVFTVEVTQDAYVYVFQNGPVSGPAVLYPHPDIGTKNPLPANTPSRIPSGEDTFELDDRDIGTEWVYIVVSRQPVDSVEASVKNVIGGGVKTMDDDATLALLKGMKAGKADDDCKERALVLKQKGCARSRGLVLKKKGKSLAVSTDPGDDVIVKAFPFRHLRSADFKVAAESYVANEGERGLIVED